MLMITGAVTVAQLGIELAKLGIEYTFAKIRPGSERPYFVVVGCVGLECGDTGATYADALDGAIARFIHRSARAIENNR